jgi:hypothetical protein
MNDRILEYLFDLIDKYSNLKELEINGRSSINIVSILSSFISGNTCLTHLFVDSGRRSEDDFETIRRAINRNFHLISFRPGFQTSQTNEVMKRNASLNQNGKWIKKMKFRDIHFQFD